MEKAEQAYSSYNDRAVLTLLATWPPGITRPDRVLELLDLAATRQERATALSEEIQQAVAAQSWVDDGLFDFEQVSRHDAGHLLPKVDEYLTLRPEDATVAAYRES